MPIDTGFEFHRLGELPLIFHRGTRNEGLAAAPNWHENLEFLYITEGEASVLCGELSVTAKMGELVCIGAGEITDGDGDTSLFYRFYHNGKICYAKAKFFTPKPAEPAAPPTPAD